MAENQAFRVERDERILLSPDSPRFRDNYVVSRPRTAAEVRAVIGLSAEAAGALQKQGARAQRYADSSASVTVDELDSKDEVARARAQHETGNALQDYVYAQQPQLLPPMEAAFGRYLARWQGELQIAVLPDIDVASGGTLTVSADTHVVRANNIIIRGTGRIVCIGSTKFEANSIVGLDL